MLADDPLLAVLGPPPASSERAAVSSGPQRPWSDSFVASRFAAPPTLLQDAWRLLLLAINWLVVGWRLCDILKPRQRQCLAGFSTLCATTLLWMVADQRSYRRFRPAIVCGLRLLLPISLLVINTAHCMDKGGTDMPASRYALMRDTWLALLSASGVLGLLQGAFSFPLHPVSSIALQLVGTAAMAASNRCTCASTYLHNPATQLTMTGIYRWLEPAVVPLEPLLLLVGVGMAHPDRHCHCVLAALQFWGALVLPTAITVRSQLRTYKGWRAREQRRVEKERRKQAASLGVNVVERSPLASGGSGHSAHVSPIDSPESVSGNEEAARRASPLASIPASLLLALPPVLLARIQGTAAASGREKIDMLRSSAHPDDWQFAAVGRAVSMMRVPRFVCALLALMQLYLYVWHREFVP